MNTSEPTTGEIVRALRCISDNAECKDCRYKYPVGNVILCDHEQMNENAADRLESLNREIECLQGEMFANALESAERIATLTARAEQAEARANAAVADMKLIVDAVREEYSDETCCFACKYDFDTSCDECGCCPGECPGFESNDCFEWRGPQAEEGDKDE